MPERLTGLKGYIGEVIVYEWLKQKYKSPSYLIASQIVPCNLDKRTSIDFGVIKGNEVIEVYEVKTHEDYNHYAVDLNKGVKYLLELAKGNNGRYFNKNKCEQLYVEENKKKIKYKISSKIKIYIVFMLPPHDDVYTALARHNKNNKVYILKKILSKLDDRKVRRTLKENYYSDMNELIERIKDS